MYIGELLLLSMNFKLVAKNVILQTTAHRLPIFTRVKRGNLGRLGRIG